MTIAYISHPFFFDMDLSLTKELFKSEIDFFFFIDLPVYAKNSNLLSIKTIKPKSGIYPSHEFPELSEYSHFINLNKTFIIYRTSKKTYSISNLKLQHKITKKIKTLNPDLIHVNNFLSYNFMHFLICNKSKKVLTIHDPIPHSGESNLKETLKRKYNYLFFKKIILLNTTQTSQFIKATNFSISDIYNSTLGAYTYLNKYISTSKSESKNKILFFGRISPYKGIEDLLKAVNLVKTEIPDIELTVAGKGNFWFDLSPYQNSPNFVFINKYISVEETVKLFNNSSFIVCPYKDATQSGVVMTAFGLNKTVLATNVGGLSEMITNSKTGILIEPNNINQLIIQIKNLLLNPQLVTQLEENIKYSTNKGDKSWSKISNDLIKTYNKILLS